MRISSKFRPYGKGRKAVRPVTGSSSSVVQAKAGDRVYDTSVLRSGENNEGRKLYSCSLDSGFRHQVRCHLAWMGFPIVGDTVYGGAPAEHLRLAATGLRFPDPEGGGYLTVCWSVPPDWATPT